jgi:hypothetical protein
VQWSCTWYDLEPQAQFVTLDQGKPVFVPMACLSKKISIPSDVLIPVMDMPISPSPLAAMPFGSDVPPGA